MGCDQYNLISEGTVGNKIYSNRVCMHFVIGGIFCNRGTLCTLIKKSKTVYT